MDINRGNMDALFTAFKTALQRGLGMATIPYDLIATTIPSSTAIEKYPFLVLLSTMREWVGPRQVQNIEGKVLEVTNKDFEHTIGVSRNDIEDDQVGLYSTLFEQMGMDAANLWGILAVDEMVANAAWLDGTNFFATNRKFGKATINNTSTSALAESTFNTAYQTMMSYQGHGGQSLNIVPDTLVVGPALRGTAFALVKAQHKITIAGSNTAAAAVDNPNQGLVDMMVHPRLVGTYANYWFLAQTKGVVKPLILQKRKVGALQRWDQESSECVKEHNRNEYGLHCRGAAAKTLPPLLYGGLVSA